MSSDAIGARAGDVLVLVRQRGALFEAIIRALKDAHVEVAGADRLVLTEHIAVMDLMVLADALLLPEDDLALATALKSPLLALDDQDLFEIAWERKTSLRAALRAKAQEVPRFAEAAAKLDRFAEWARLDTPFGFYARVLGAERGRKRFLARLGHEANDALDELLNLALDYERRETPSLQGFIAWLRSARSDVKRDMEITRDEVRVMTVHGAKGLEAPIVVLADTITPPAGPGLRQPRLLDLAADHTPTHFVWAGPKANDVTPVAAARERRRRENEDEHRRLLYVAMTRAIERLVVCGRKASVAVRRVAGFNLVADALQPISDKEPAEDGEGDVWRYRPTPPRAGAPNASAGLAAAMPHDLPPWLGQAVPAATPPILPLSPSRAYDEETVRVRPPAGAAAVEREKAMARGVLVHRLLQSLPGHSTRGAGRRRPAASGAQRQRIQRRGARGHARAGASRARRFAFLRGVLAREPRRGPDRGAPPRPAGLRPSGPPGRDRRCRAYSGLQTNRPAPERFEDVPPAYTRQLALYRAVLAELFPDKTIRAALLWTEIPDLMEIPAAAMDRELAAVTSP